MRKYTPKNDVQKKSYYNDRFWVAPHTPKFESAHDKRFGNDIKILKENFDVKDNYVELGFLVVMVDAKQNFEVIKFLKEQLGYKMLTEVSAIDYLAQSGEFEIFYHMLNLEGRKRIRVKCRLKENQAIASVEPLFRSADWSEREMYDMYGVKINNHPYMKRILMPDDWHGHPLRKDYPLEGDEFAKWYEVDKIFGKEARDIIGPENRDPAMVDRYDTERFSRLGHEVPFGADISNGEPDTPIQYQEEGGVPLVGKMDPKTSKTIERR